MAGVMPVMKSIIERFGPIGYLVTALDGSCSSRIAVIMPRETHNDFFSITTKSSSKFKEIKTNPNVLFLLYDAKTVSHVFCKATVDILEDSETRHALWCDSWREHGHNGPDDTNLVFLRYNFSAIIETPFMKPPIVHTFPLTPVDPVSVDVSVATPTPDLDRATALLREFLEKDSTVLMCTRDGETDLAARFMNLRHRFDVGLYGITKANSPKVRQLQKNPHACLHWYLPESGFKQLIAQATVHVDTQPELCRLLWRDEMRRFGFAGPEEVAVLRVAVSRLHMQPMAAPGVSYGLPAAPLPTRTTEPAPEEDGAKAAGKKHPRDDAAADCEESAGRN
ncbi:hypothetical protein PAPYR_4205 [Paratrimastix pyriformis]|uniref:General stress protein FMN-binding split barrel domain-containing protein n=1 Tax=Paratrimastix pyriformis TaxID=342808 RepID=A0ABQ8UKS6_9EUKA|nr:hypothetical protein PAPYR_4205 [Paratrimastix pyriformis]